MDHLLKVSESTFFTPDVKYVCRADFETIIRDYGFKEYPTYHPNGDSHYVHAIAALTQEWLYFGFLQEVLRIVDITFRKEDFIRLRQDGIRVVTSERLPRLLRRWGEIFRKGYRKGKTHQWQQLSDLCSIVVPRVQTIGQRLSLQRAPADSRHLSEEETLHLALCVLLEMVQDELEEEKLLIIQYGRPDKSLKMPYLNGIVRLNGRCSYHLQGFFGRPRELYLLARLPATGSKLHFDCDKRQCVASAIKEADYETKHVNGCDSKNCEFIGPSTSGLLYHYDGGMQPGQIPVVCPIAEGGKLTVKMDVVSGDYTAISHCWSDGLGNRQENKLPTCQVRRLSELAAKVRATHPTDFDIEGWLWLSWLICICGKVGSIFGCCIRLPFTLLFFLVIDPPGDSWTWKDLWKEIRSNFTGKRLNSFWIDTLCIPCKLAPIGDGQDLSVYENYHDMKRRVARKSAILQIHKIFATASRVLVLDSDLQQVGRNRLERIYRVHLSQWMTRLWTLQEATTAQQQNLFFQLKDGVLGQVELLILQNLYLYFQTGPRYAGLIYRIFTWRSVSNFQNAHLMLKTTETDSSPEAMESTPLADSQPTTDNSAKLFRTRPATWLSFSQAVLASRSTSNDADEALCIAASCGMDATLATLVTLDGPTQRMETLMKGFGGKFDVDIIFSPRKRMRTTGLRWCPESFLSCAPLSEVPPGEILGGVALSMDTGGTTSSLSKVAGWSGKGPFPWLSLDATFCEDRGLQCSLAAWRWDGIRPQPDSFLVKREGSQELHRLQDRTLGARKEEPLSQKRQAKLAILWRKGPVAFTAENGINAVLVEVLKQQPRNTTHIPVSFICPITVTKFHPDETDAGTDMAGVPTVSELDKSSKWLID